MLWWWFEDEDEDFENFSLAPFERAACMMDNCSRLYFVRDKGDVFTGSEAVYL